MYKTRLGITVGLLGALVYFAGLFGGFLTVMFLVGYILLFEQNEWLRKSAVKAAALMIFFDFFVVIVNLIPNAIGLINNIAVIFGGNFSVAVLTKIVTAIVSALDIMEKLLFIGLGVKALRQGTIVIPAIDKLISKYME